MKNWIAVYIADGEYGKKGDVSPNIVQAEDENGCYAKGASDFARKETVKYVEAEEGMDPRHYKGEESEGQHATASHGGVNFVSTRESQKANDITLEFDGVKTISEVVSNWNTQHQDNTVSHDASDDGEVLDEATVQLSGGQDVGVNLVADQDKTDEANNTDALAEVSKKYVEMREEVYQEMEEQFGTRSLDSGNAYQTTWERMSSNPANYMGIAYKADIDTTSFNKGEVLDTETKIENFANEALAKVDDFMIFRKNKLETFRDERDALLNP